MGLEEIIMKNVKKILIFSDLHFPYQDNRAIEVMMEYNKKVYKPTDIVINGDILDFYRLSDFEHNPARKETIQEDINQVKNFFSSLKKYFPRSRIYYLEGNHENRLQRYLWKNPELISLDVLKLENMLNLKRRKIKFTPVHNDYWKKGTGHLKLGDTIIMHGDNRANGAKGGKYGCINTMIEMNSNIVMGHNHQLGVNYFTNLYKNLHALNTGCLCQISGMAQWNQGFVTFEQIKGVSYNHRTHQINDGVLLADGVKYVSKAKNLPL